MSLFSRRNAEPPDRYSYTIPTKVWSRMLHTLQQHNGGWMGGSYYNLDRLLEEVRRQLLARLGGLRLSTDGASHVNEHPVIVHFFCCTDEEALDFIQFCFSADCMCGDSEDSRKLVNAFNRLFEEEGIGYEITPPATIDIGPGSLFGGRSSGARAIRFELPKVIKKDERTFHAKAVAPALERLRDARLLGGDVAHPLLNLDQPESCHLVHGPTFPKTCR